ncbi:APC10-domain-containing protein [Laetiporus sulphureus 93-53]|uniref:APC10-domain-containing protein n=1 Tax=Laetiporus sulphureus 93-53 TaxID=1314785 RepID=A0A165AZ54_9APHY|nr:APC10-domain-containing protein [Laetiporus sulphureus 93-53]KZS99928.1 APC10-domain-containing protein [Laetiporus sulphureus 93-53]
MTSVSAVGPIGINHVAQLPTDGTPIMHAGRKPPSLPWPDIGHLAKWSVSSYKFGFGPECLRDDDPDTFWHSDGPQPHFITVEFPRKVAIQKLSLYLSFPADDSYTPATIAVRAGTGLHDLQDVRAIHLDKPDGWITFDVSAEPSPDGDGFKPIHAYVIQVIILTNHMNGKDTHVRGLRVLGPFECVTIHDQTLPHLLAALIPIHRETSSDNEDPFPFVAPCFKMYERIR